MINKKWNQSECQYPFSLALQTISETERVVREAMTAPRRSSNVKLDSDSLIEDAIQADAQGKSSGGHMW